jgi:hypothetical protein
MSVATIATPRQAGALGAAGGGAASGGRRGRSRGDASRSRAARRARPSPAGLTWSAARSFACRPIVACADTSRGAPVMRSSCRPMSFSISARHLSRQRPLGHCPRASVRRSRLADVRRACSSSRRPWSIRSASDDRRDVSIRTSSGRWTRRSGSPSAFDPDARAKPTVWFVMRHGSETAGRRGRRL